MSFAEVFNAIDWLYRATQQDPLTFLVVYPMTLMTTSVLTFALLQDLFQATQKQLMPAPVRVLKNDDVLAPRRRKNQANRAA
jgi:hypothetical protein